MLSLASAGLFAPKWTAQIEMEWVNAMRAQRPDIPMDRLNRTIEHMRAAIPDWEVPAFSYGPLMASLTLPDSDDVHVLAAAIAGHADCIVTSNLKDFPGEIITQNNIEVLHPDDFIVYQLDLAPLEGLGVIKAMRARLKAPPLDTETFLNSLVKGGLSRTATWLRKAKHLI